MRRVDEQLPASVSEGRVKTTIRVDEYTWTRFQARTKELGLSTCFVLENLMRMWTFSGQAQVPGASVRDLHLHVQYGVTRPRRYPILEESPLNYTTPNCRHVDAYYKSGSVVMCGKFEREVNLQKCWDCYARREV